MKRFIRFWSVLSFSLLFSNAAVAQLVSDAYCKDVENSVIKPLNPTHWYHNIVFNNECSFEFDIEKNVAVRLIIEKSKTAKAARKSLRSDIEMYEDQHFIDRGKDFKLPGFGRNNFWDEAYFSESYGPMLLRKERTFITVFCDDKKLCPQIEKSLRGTRILREYRAEQR
ncbi:MAG TPA: hypothetical protein VGB68_13705 [Pyrinomonadaceae bacterium]|jgi:hypothetical protein